MSTALVSGHGPMLVLYLASLALVLWGVIDMARRSTDVLPPGKKAAWIIGSVAGWLFFGFIGAIVVILYLVGPRRRMNARSF